MAEPRQLPSGKWRVQVRRSGLYRAATFTLKREAEAWARDVERQAEHVAASGFMPTPKHATVGDLIEKYLELFVREPGRTKAATLAMLKRRIGDVRLVNLNAIVLRDLIDSRMRDGAGGVTIAADLSFLSAVLKWGKHARQLDVRPELAKEARQSLKHRGLDTRGHERDREPTDDELSRLYAAWRANERQRIDMPLLCDFALATGMRLGEICSLRVEDIDHSERTVVIRDRKDPRNKVGNHQTVPLLPKAWAIAERLSKGRDTGRLFEVEAKSASTAFTRACTRLGIEDLHFHDTRHRAAAEFFRMGLDIPRVALMTGHKTWAMLRRYTQIKPSDVHAAVAAKGASVASTAKSARRTAAVRAL